MSWNALVYVTLELFEKSVFDRTAKRRKQYDN